MLQVDVVVRAEYALARRLVVILQDSPDAVPARLADTGGVVGTSKFERDAEVILVPLVIRGACKGLVGEGDEGTVGHSEIDRSLAGEEVGQRWVHLELFGDTLVYRVVPVDHYLDAGAVRKS